MSDSSLRSPGSVSGPRAGRRLEADDAGTVGRLPVERTHDLPHVGPGRPLRS